MKTIQSLIELIKEILSEAAENWKGLDDQQLVPVPLERSERDLPTKMNHR
jgi:hypothetical protein